MTIILSPDQELRIERVLRGCAYQNAGEVIDRALDLLHVQQAWLDTEREAIEAKIGLACKNLIAAKEYPKTNSVGFSRN